VTKKCLAVEWTTLFYFQPRQCSQRLKLSATSVKSVHRVKTAGARSWSLILIVLKLIMEAVLPLTTHISLYGILLSCSHKFIRNAWRNYLAWSLGKWRINLRKDQYGDLFAHTHQMMCKGTANPIQKRTGLEGCRNVRLSELLDGRHMEVERLLARIMYRRKKYVCQLRIYIDLGGRIYNFMSLYQ
jgi:hypothetical protein